MIKRPSNETLIWRRCHVSGTLAIGLLFLAQFAGSTRARTARIYTLLWNRCQVFGSLALPFLYWQSAFRERLWILNERRVLTFLHWADSHAEVSDLATWSSTFSGYKIHASRRIYSSKHSFCVFLWTNFNFQDNFWSSPKMKTLPSMITIRLTHPTHLFTFSCSLLDLF